MFNPNELILEKIKTVEEYDPGTYELIGRFTQIESPSLKVNATSTNVTDAMGTEIASFYQAQTATFSFTNSLFSLDLAATQFGSKKQIADNINKLLIPVSETITIDSTNHTAVLKYTPVGVTGAEVKYAKVINENNTFGKTYEVSPTIGAEVFTIDATTKTLTFPSNVTGRVFVQYERESDSAVMVSKTTNVLPEIRSLLIHAIFHDPCNVNVVYAGIISVPRAQINPESVEINLTPDGKHSVEYKLQKPYCDESARLFDIIVTEE